MCRCRAPVPADPALDRPGVEFGPVEEAQVPEGTLGSPSCGSGRSVHLLGLVESEGCSIRVRLPVSNQAESHSRPR